MREPCVYIKFPTRYIYVNIMDHHVYQLSFPLKFVNVMSEPCAPIKFSTPKCHILPILRMSDRVARSSFPLQHPLFLSYIIPQVLLPAGNPSSRPTPPWSLSPLGSALGSSTPATRATFWSGPPRGAASPLDSTPNSRQSADVSICPDDLLSIKLSCNPKITPNYQTNLEREVLIRKVIHYYYYQRRDLLIS